jgi:long-chain acyl-CoA synthetase
MNRDPITRSFEKVSRRRPTEPLVYGVDEVWTAGDVGDTTKTAEGHLRSARYDDGSLVGLAACNGPGFIAGFLAMRRLGFTVLLLDWGTPEAECTRIGESLGAAGILRVRRSFPRGPEDFALRSFGDPRGAAVTRFAPDIATVRLTSGSTGVPQGIMHSSEALIADDSNLSAVMGLKPEERILAAIPMSHAYGFISVFLPCVLRGSVVVVPERGDPYAAPRAAVAGDVTFLPTVPAYLKAVLSAAEPPPLPAGLRLVISAGAPLAPEVAVRFRETYGRPVHVFYGASEVGGIAYDKDGTAGERGTLGTPVDGVEVTLEPVDGVEQHEGLVAVRSEAVARGYFPQPSPSLSNGRFRSTDVAVIQHGEIVLRGRLDEFINVRGKKVNPREVETILRNHERVDEAAVFGVIDRETLEQRICAVIERSSRDVGYEEIRSWCREHLASHKVPRTIVVVDQLPRNERGKLDRPAIRALAATDD